jgi:glycerophosphoryl diester phosphodiesterase
MELVSNLKNSNADQVMVIAHRGSWRHAPENSIQSLAYAIEMGVDMVEIDVRMTRDSVLVLMHDKTIDRTTNGTGNLQDMTYDSLQNFWLLNGLQQTTPHRVPTLEEALWVCKDKILVNLDTKDYDNLGLYHELLQRTGTLNQVLVKATMTQDQARGALGSYYDQLYFMPIVRTAAPRANAIVQEYLQDSPPIAFEFTIPSDTTSLLAQFSAIRKAGSRVWVNSLRPHHCAGHDDEQAAIDIHQYDWFIDHHVNMIQTDRPALLIDYLRARGLHH